MYEAQGSTPSTIKNMKDNKYWQKCGEKGSLAQCWWECKLVQPLKKTVRKFLKKIKIDDPVTPLLGTYPKKKKSVC
jgi:hypothetical protein